MAVEASRVGARSRNTLRRQLPPVIVESLTNKLSWCAFHPMGRRTSLMLRKCASVFCLYIKVCSASVGVILCGGSVVPVGLVGHWEYSRLWWFVCVL